MLTLVILLIVISFFYFVIGLNIIRIDSKKVNKRFFTICVDLSLWTTLSALQFFPHSETTDKILGISMAFLIMAFFSFIILFFITLTKHDFLLDKAWKKILSIIPFAIGIYLYCIMPSSDGDFASAVIGEHFLRNTGRGILYNSYYYIHFTFSVFISIFLLYRWFVKTKVKREKMQAKIIIYSMLLTMVLILIADIKFVELFKNDIEVYSIILISIPVAAISYSINKYRLMNLDPKNVAYEMMTLMNEGLIVLDEKDIIQDVNDGAITLLGFEIGEMKGKNISEFLIESTEVINESRLNGFETSANKKNEQKIHILLSSATMWDCCGEKLSTVIIFQDITNLKNIQEQILKMNNDLELIVEERTKELLDANMDLSKEIDRRMEIEANIKHLAEHDELTDLPNRRLFYYILHRELSNIEENQYLAIAFLDIDLFKNVNDTFGHAVGDLLLKEISNRLTSKLEDEVNTIARIAGDEFLILFNQEDDKELYREKVNMIFECFKEPFVHEQEKLFINTSVGISVYPEDGEDIETLIKNADIALYKAKDEGKNTYKYCNSLMKDQVKEEMKLTNSLYNALSLNQIEVYYQPQVNQLNGKIIGFEALARWNHPELGLVSPGSFIPIAEKTGLIDEIGEYVLRTACQQNKKWQQDGYTDIFVAVNISVVQIKKDRFVNMVNEVILETGLNPKFLELEITESILIKNIDDIINKLLSLKNFGIKISMDDFGTEYSSLKYLKSLPVDKIKIAREFISQIGVSIMDEEILSSIIKLIKKLDYYILAEGAETKEQIDFLRMLDCKNIQGYYFYKPMPVNEVERILKENNYKK